jgi:hypothetical protein
MQDIVAQVAARDRAHARDQPRQCRAEPGIGQVGEAVAQLDQVTQQNAALVEQSAAAAESLGPPRATPGKPGCRRRPAGRTVAYSCRVRLPHALPTPASEEPRA